MEKPEIIDHIGWRLWLAARAWKSRFDRKMIERDYLWFGEARANLLQHIPPSGILQNRLVELAAVSKQAVQQHLDDLEKDGVIKRVADEKDARRKWVKYTRKGEQSLFAANEVKREIEQEYAEIIGADAMQGLSQALTSIAAFENDNDD